MDTKFYGFFLLLINVVLALPIPEEGSQSDKYENSTITIKQVHLKPNQTLEVLLEIQSKVAEKDMDAEKIGLVAGQILNEYYHQSKYSLGGIDQRNSSIYKNNNHIKFAISGNEDDEAEESRPIKFQTNDLVQIGSDPEADIYEDIEKVASPSKPKPVLSYVHKIPSEVKSAEPVKSNAEIISNILSSVDRPRGYNKTYVSVQQFEAVPTESIEIDATEPTTPASDKPVSSNGPITLGADTQALQVPVTNVIRLPPLLSEPRPVTAAPDAQKVAAPSSTDEDEDDDEDEDEDNNARVVARNK